jgi:hypothetical protein
LELPNHSGCPLSLRLLADRWAAFLVTYSLMQDEPDQSTLSMGDCPDGLLVSETRYGATIHNFKDASFGSGCGIGHLVQKASHVTVALGRGTQCHRS